MPSTPRLPKAPQPQPTNALPLLTMECATCERSQRKFYCADCVKNNIYEYRSSGSRIEDERADLVVKTNELIRLLEPRRLERAQRWAIVERTKEVKRETQRLREHARQIRERVAAAKERLRVRRDNLTAAGSLSREPLTLTPLTAAQARLDTLADRLALARRGLALLLIQVFDLKQGQDKQTYICSLTFPFPGDHRHYPPDHINGVITHTLHFLNLLVFYLGVKLPFQIQWSGGHPGVGKPTIRAGGGYAEDGDWVKWTVKQPLYVSSADLSRSAAVPSSFTTAISMLAFNIMYLLHAESLTPPASLPPNILQELSRLCQDNGIGRRSHSTRPHLPPPTHGFDIPFTRVLEAAKEADGSKRAEERARHEDGDGDWDIIVQEEDNEPHEPQAM